MDVPGSAGGVRSVTGPVGRWATPDAPRGRRRGSAAASLAAVDAAGLIVPVAVGVGSAYVVVLAVGVGRRRQ
jgi:hypothetical protein